MTGSQRKQRSTWVAFGRFWVDFGGFWGSSGRVLGGSRACFRAEKATYINFQEIDFVAIGGACAFFYDEFVHLVLVPK